MTSPDTTPSLEGFNIGLSGAVPERDTWTEDALDRAILEFIAVFSALVLQQGGRIIHGSHPSFTPVIVRQARRHPRAQGRKPVTLVVSELWAKSMDADEIVHYQEVAEILVTRQVGEGGPDNPETRNASLKLMRHHLLQQMNALVAVGGKLHEQDRSVPGVLAEVRLAQQRGMTTFLVGGMGGMAARLVKERSHELSLRNELPPEQNEQLQTTTDIEFCASTVINHLSLHPEFVTRALARLEVKDDDCIAYPVFMQKGATWGAADVASASEDVASEAL